MPTLTKRRELIVKGRALGLTDGEELGHNTKIGRGKPFLESAAHYKSTFDMTHYFLIFLRFTCGFNGKASVAFLLFWSSTSMISWIIGKEEPWPRRGFILQLT
jgi:hypothetical protein